MKARRILDYYNKLYISRMREPKFITLYMYSTPGLHDTDDILRIWIVGQRSRSIQK